jgi:hypothetical protein
MSMIVSTQYAYDTHVEPKNYPLLVCGPTSLYEYKVEMGRDCGIWQFRCTRIGI